MWSYKLQIIFQFCFHYLDKISSTYSSNPCNIFSCSDGTENMQGFSKLLMHVFWISLFVIHLCFHSSTVLSEEMHLLWSMFRKMPNRCSVFIFTSNCMPIMYERRWFVFITAIQNFSKFTGCQESWKMCNPRMQD